MGYVCGGIDEGGRVVQSFQRFVAARSAWEELPEPKYLRSGALALAMGANLFICGGVEVCSANRTTLVHKSMECFNTRTCTWHELQQMPVARGCPVGACLVGEIYIFGGQGAIMHYVQGEEIPIKSVGRFNPKREAWEELPPMTSQRYKMAAVT